MGVCDYVAIGRDVGLILARRVDTWDDPYDEQVGWDDLNWALALTFFCCLRQPRIASGATHFFTFQWFGMFICGEWVTSFIMLCEPGKRTLAQALSGKPNSGTRPPDFAGEIAIKERLSGAMAGLTGRVEWV